MIPKGRDNIGDTKNLQKVKETFLKVVTSNRNNVDVEEIKKALSFAERHHINQKRDSGEPYITHPIAVATIVNDLHLDTISIVTALLHDTVEDTDATIQDIRQNFSDKIAQLVNGVTKLSKIHFKSIHTKQAENFRKLMMAISDDIRVLLVKLADRLHNMRTIGSMKDAQKRKQKAQETMEIYAPLAERMGMYNVKNELQDLAFAEVHPDIRDNIMQRVKQQYDDELLGVNQITKEISEKINKLGIAATVHSRKKTPCAIWYKMQEKNIDFEDFSDIVALRIVTKTVRECYLVLGILHESYRMVPDSFKDYISTPKINGYQSLHTVIIGPTNHKAEVQIRTEQMHAISEHGLAGHWSYKQKGDFGSGQEYKGVRELIDILQNTHNPEELLESSKLQLAYDQVFCFTPKGEVVALPKGATPVDLAFALHENIGKRCEGAKINNTIAPIGTEISNGDQVEILLSKTPKVFTNMEKYAVTGKAKVAIRKFLRSQQKDEYVLLAKRILHTHAKVIGVQFEQSMIKKEVLNDMKSNSVSNTLAAVAKGRMDIDKLLNSTVKNSGNDMYFYSNPFMMLYRKIRKFALLRYWSIPIGDLIDGIAIHCQDCCNPIHGDKIVGILVQDKGMYIHSKFCAQFAKIVRKIGRYNVYSLSWSVDEEEEEERDNSYEMRLKISLHHRMGALSSMAAVMEKHSLNITNLELVKRTNKLFDFVVDILLSEDQDINPIISELHSLDAVASVRKMGVL